MSIIIKRMRDERILLKSENHQAEGLLLIPDRPERLGIILAHGAGGNMNDRFISFFHAAVADAGYTSLKFNFPYSQNKRKVPDPQPVLTACYKKAIEAMPVRNVV